MCNTDSRFFFIHPSSISEPALSVPLWTQTNEPERRFLLERLCRYGDLDHRLEDWRQLATDTGNYTVSHAEVVGGGWVGTSKCGGSVRSVNESNIIWMLTCDIFPLRQFRRLKICHGPNFGPKFLPGTDKPFGLGEGLATQRWLISSSFTAC